MDRDTAISQYRERLNMSKPLILSNLMILVAEFIKSMESSDPVSLFESELALLREGYSDQDIGSMLIPAYREAIGKQVAGGKLQKALALSVMQLMVNFETGVIHRPTVKKRDPELIERDILDLRRELADAYQAYWENSEIKADLEDLKNATRHKIICAIDAMMEWNNKPDNKKYEIGVQTIHKVTGSKDLYIREVFGKHQLSITAHNNKHQARKQGRYNNDEAIRYCIDRLESIHGISFKKGRSVR